MANWVTGTRPVKNKKYVEHVSDAVNELHAMYEEDTTPRSNSCSWIRHVKRCLMLRHMKENCCPGVMLSYMLMSENEDMTMYVRGFWDGGHNPGDDMVALE